MTAYIPEPGDTVTVNDFSGKAHSLKVIDTTEIPVRKKYGKVSLKIIPYLDDAVIDLFVENLRYRNRHHYDNIVAFTGEERVGKSNTAVRVAHLLDPSFDESRIIFDTKDLPEMIANLEPGQCIIIDEAGKEINNRNWARAPQKELVSSFQVFGKKRINIFIVSPRLSYIDSAIRQTRLRYWVQVKARRNGADRGYITIKEAERDDYTNDTWWATMIAGKINPPSDFEELIPLMEAYEKRKDDYIMSVLLQKDEDGEPVPQFQNQRDRMIWFLLESKVLTQRQLEVLTGLKPETTRKIKRQTSEEITDDEKFMLDLIDSGFMEGMGED